MPLLYNDPFNRVILYPCGVQALFTPDGRPIDAQYDPEPEPGIPTTTNQQPTDMIIENDCGVQRFG